MFVSALLLAAGSGKRFKSKIPKPLASIRSFPIILYSLRALARHPLIKDIIVVVNRKNILAVRDCVKEYRIKKTLKFVQGGERRQDSVLCGLKALSHVSDFVLIHDAARPFIDKRMISAVIQSARKSEAAIVGVPVKATIKRVKRSLKPQASSRTHHNQGNQEIGKSGDRALLVEQTLNRENLWEIQTPQVFKKDVILEAHRRFGKANVTDDAMLVEKLGVRVAIVPGSYRNIKITTPEDLLIAEALARFRLQSRLAR